MIERIKNLSDKQRAALIEHLGATSKNSERQQLVAYVVAKDGGELNIGEVRANLKQRLPDYMIPAHFVTLDAMPRLPNGKIDRSKLPEPVIPKKPHAQSKHTENKSESILLKIWSDVLGISELNPNDNFFEAGGDSILSIQIVARAKQAGLNITPAQLFQYPTVSDLAAVAEKAQAKISLPQDSTDKDIPLTPIQQWFFTQNFRFVDHWNQAVILETDRALDVAQLERATAQVIARHDALRTCFEKSSGGWAQSIAQPTTTKTTKIERISVSSEAEANRAVLKLQSSLKLENAETLRAVVMDFGEKSPLRIVIVAHHLVIDTVSWSILLEDLERAYVDENVSLVTSSSYRTWSHALRDGDAMPKEDERLFWLELSKKSFAAISTDHDTSTNLEGSTRQISFTLEQRETQELIEGLAISYNARPHEALLCALGVTMGEWLRGEAALIGVEHHGRETIASHLDLSRSIGWFTAYYPFELRLNPIHLGERIAQTKDALRSVPRNGIGFGQLRYLGDAKTQAALDRIARPQILFNYSGQFEQTLGGLSRFKWIDVPTPHTRDANEQRAFLIELNAVIIQQQLRIEWIYSESVHRAETIERLGQRFSAALREIIAHCQARDSRKLTASDFASSGLNQSELDELLGELGG
jgi:non-ribosomal peptide synthase protein (TIGR01720 family)